MSCMSGAVQLPFCLEKDVKGYLPASHADIGLYAHRASTVSLVLSPDSGAITA
jgi:hypothetical protein